MDVSDPVPDAIPDPRFPRPMSHATYTAMVERGELDGERVELIRGVVVKVSPILWPHAAVTVALDELFHRQLDLDLYSVRCQQPFIAVADSEPEPDVMVVRKDPARRVHPSEALLIIEVSDSSLRYDRGTKLELYAESNVPEYWVVDVTTMSIEVYTEPEPVTRRYAQVRVFRDGDVVRPTLVPGVAIAVADLPR